MHKNTQFSIRKQCHNNIGQANTHSQRAKLNPSFSGHPIKNLGPFDSHTNVQCEQYLLQIIIYVNQPVQI